MSENIFNVFAILLNLIWASHFHCFTIYSADDHYLLWTLCNRHSSASEVHRGFNFDQFAFAIPATDHCTILWCSYVRIGTSPWLPTPLSSHAQALLSSTIWGPNQIQVKPTWRPTMSFGVSWKAFDNIRQSPLFSFTSCFISNLIINFFAKTSVKV